jgi:acyl transferase domain-containing protein/thioesterase domain-containing protein
VEGQAEVIAEALGVAGVTADDISYVETHGTGTAVGDPIEIRALTQAFRESSARRGYCGIGSLKTNVGHLDAAAGVAGLIKTVLALENRQIPASLNFETPNPLIDFKNSPFFVNSALSEWTADGSPRRAGVTSLGIGGTNAHVVLEEAPPAPPSSPAKPYQLLTVSAKTEPAVQRACANLAAHLQEHPELNLADVAFTCQVGRQALAYRRAVVARDAQEASRALAAGDFKPSVPCPPKAPGVAFMFSGQGSQYVNMGREIYETEAVFRGALDHCAERLEPLLNLDLRQALYPPDDGIEDASARLNETWLTQPALFAVEYSLAQWWMSLGVHPHAMVGHSIGEYVAACLAQVLSLEDALEITAFRGRLIYSLPAGSMLAVPLPPGEVHQNGSLSVAAINNPGQCVVSGPTPEIEALEKSLAGQSISCRRLHTSHAFHSAMMDPVLDRFVERLRDIELRAPQIPYLSNVTGTWIKAEEATDPGYWARHLRQTVRFSDCLEELFGERDRILLEVGPGQALASLARQHSPNAAKVFQSLRHPHEKTSDLRFALRTLGEIWISGGEVDWGGLHPADSARRVSLPAYPFEHKRFWIDPDAQSTLAAPSPAPAPAPENRTDQWFYQRVWKRSDLKQTALHKAGCCLLFQDSAGLGDSVAAELTAKRQKVIRVEAGSGYRRLGDGNYTVRPEVRGDYDALIADVLKSGHSPNRIVHLWSVLPPGSHPPIDETLNRSFYSPLFLTQALADQDMTGLDFTLVSNAMQPVSGEAIEDPARAVLLGPVRVIPQELPGIACRAIDVDAGNGRAPECAAQIVAELAAAPKDDVVAYRRGERFTESIERISLSPAKPRLQAKGVYLITGGLGGIGLAVAAHLAHEFKARLVLTGRSALPPETEWEACLKSGSESETTRDKIRKLLDLRSSGAEILVVRADVTNIDEMKQVVDLARHRFGEINGVFHAAGAIEDRPLMLKTAESAARVLDAKVRGTLVLEEALRGSPLSCFVLFSSISSVLPPAGQVDYAAANAFLDAFASSRNGAVTAVDWGLWRGVGLGRASSHPLLEHRLVENPEERVYSCQLSQQQHWVLAEHRLKTGKALIPGTGYLEIAAAALDHGSFEVGVEFEDVFFLAPLTFDRQDSKEVRVRLRREGKAFRFSILAQDDDWIEHSTGSLCRMTPKPPAPLDRAAIAARCRDREIIFDDQHRTKQERYFDFGPRWRSLKRIQFGKRECLAELELNEGLRGDIDAWRMHPALLDMATGCALYLTEGYGSSQDLYLPFSYKRIRSYLPIPPKVFSYIRSRDENTAGAGVAVFDVTLFDEQGRVLIEAEGFTMRLIADPSSAAAGGTRARADVHPGNSGAEAGERLAIPALDGVQLLVRLLTSETPPVVIVSPQDLETLKPTPPAVSPSAGSSLPSDEVETTLAAWWRELLGTEQLSLEDDFFDLGGHSLIAVRLFSKIKKTYHLELGLAAIFEARTIRKLAELIRTSISSGNTKPRAWKSIIPIQPNGARPPLFLVHALGPSVLFYEELAKSLGPSQPVYGLQSPFASPEHPQRESLEELASLYLEEVQRFLPEGPYLLGGASLGGLIAFEMAQQLYREGKKPDVLVLLDAFVPGSRRRVATRDQASQHWHNIQSRGFGYVFEKLAGKAVFYGMKIAQYSNIALTRCYQLAGLPVPDGLRSLQVEHAHKQVMQRYRVQAYPGKITLMRAVDVYEPVGKRRDPANGWQEMAGGGLDVHDVPGGHNSMLVQPNVKILADELRKILPA